MLSSTENEIKAETAAEQTKRLGALIILYAFEDLEKWNKDIKDYSPRQLSQIKKGDPLTELDEFFFGPCGLDHVIEVFDVQIDARVIRKKVGEMIANIRNNNIYKLNAKLRPLKH